MNFKIVFLTIIIAGFLFNCKSKRSLNNQVLHCICSESQTNASKDYLPEKLYIFSNDICVALCGDIVKDSLNSEFSFYNCKSQKLIEEYNDDYQLFKIEFEEDTLRIVNFKNLPIGKNWEYKSTPVYFDFITTGGDSLTSLNYKIIFERPQISEEKQIAFLDDIILNRDNGLQHDWSWEEIISKLEVLTLMGNTRAEELIYDLEKVTNYKFDGGVAEHYKDAIATIELLSR